MRHPLFAMMLLCAVANGVVISQEVKPAFDPTSPKKSAFWCASIWEPVAKIKNKGNRLAIDAEIAKVQRNLNTIVGKKVKWPMTVISVTEEGVEFQVPARKQVAFTSCNVYVNLVPLAGNQNRPRFYKRFPAPKEKWILNVFRGDVIFVEGEVARVHGDGGCDKAFIGVLIKKIKMTPKKTK